jgi:hypothetical protein
MDRQEFTRLLEEERRQLENAWLNSATDLREFISMRKTFPKLPTTLDLPRDQMTGADYCRIRRHDTDPLGRPIK